MDAVGGCGDLGIVRQRRDRTKRLRRLSESHDLAVRGVDTRGVLVVTLAVLERAVLGGVGAVVRNTDTVEDVLSEVRRVWTSRVANLEAERVRAHEARCILFIILLMLKKVTYSLVPFNDLLEGIVVPVVARETVGVDESTKRVTTLQAR